MFFTLRQMSISIWILVVQSQLLLILKQQETGLRKDIIPAELHPPRPLSVEICIP